MREFSSRRLDDELSPFEQAILDDHLASCARCSEFDRQLAAIVGRLRTAPQAQPERLVMLPQRRRVLAPSVRFGAVAAAAAAAVAAFVPGLVSHVDQRSAQRARIAAAIASANNEDVAELHLIRTTGNIPERVFLIAHGRGPRPT